jgi:hypothetical protein
LGGLKEKTMKIEISEKQFKFVERFAKQRKLETPEEGLEKLISLAEGRLKALKTWNAKKAEAAAAEEAPKPKRERKPKAEASEKPKRERVARPKPLRKKKAKSAEGEAPGEEATVAEA